MSKDQKSNKLALGFNNFRKFEDFPILEFGEITYLVGRNNAGKSTLVKALVLVFEYLKNQQNDTFKLNSDIIDNINIPNFGRAVTFGSKSNHIDFTIHIGKWECNIVIKGEGNKTEARLSDVQFHSPITSLVYNFDSDLMVISQELMDDTKIHMDAILLVTRKISELGKELDKVGKKSRQGIEIIHQIESLKERIINTNDKPELKKIMLSQNMKSRLNNTTGRLYIPDLDERYSEFQLIVEQELESLDKNGLMHGSGIKVDSFASMKPNLDDDIDELIKNRELFLDDKNTLMLKQNERLFQKLRNSDIQVISAISSKQSSLFLIRDKENSLAQIIHTIYNQHHSAGSQQNLFIKKWMSLFEIGDDYSIKRISDEAYEFKVFTKDKLMDLCDKGTGSMQAMMIILKIASLIKLLEQKNNELGNEKTNLTSIIQEGQGEMIVLLEEPEVNLHPALQSLLTQFFHDVNKEYKLKFIIETHSEYAIRKSQVLVKKEEYTDDDSLNPNPFKTYYFPTDDVPYEMIYRPDGKFENSFKSGFFDINADLATDLL
ncbi:ATP-binding protein [Crocinitomicaceae bacterium]|nr:ATP-binding protein [Crocinitomicaceae bacterium]